MFGDELEFFSTSYAEKNHIKSRIFDNTYARYLLYYGIIAYGILVLLFFVFFRKAYKEQKYFLILIILAFNFYMMIESRMDSFVFTLLIGKGIFNESSIKKKE